LLVIEIFPGLLPKNDVPSAVGIASIRIAEFVARTAYKIAMPWRNCGRKERAPFGEIFGEPPIKSA